MAITRSNVEGIVGFIAANLDGATDLEREALAAYQADPEAAIERALTETEPSGTVETFVMFTPEQLRHAGAHYLAEQARAASSAESPELAETHAETVTVRVSAYIDNIDREDAKEEADRIREVIEKALKDAGYAAQVEADIEAPEAA